MKRGVVVRCLLCPKKGGAMKPTSLFTSQANYNYYYPPIQNKQKSAQKQSDFCNNEVPPQYDFDEQPYVVNVVKRQL